MQKKDRKFSCSDCSALHCWKGESQYPAFCVNKNPDEEMVERIKQMYIDDPFVSKINNCAVDVDREHYYQLSRAEEMILFAQGLGVKKVGVATCVALLKEAKVFCEMLAKNGIDYYCAGCKVGAIDKSEVDLERYKLKEGTYDPICNPVMQAELLNKENTDLNIIIGLCVGHDTLFIKYSNAPVTYLVVKDRVLVHNSVAALQKDGFYYKKACHEEGEI